MKTQEFNKVIWMYWEQGFSNAPKIVLKCVDSWKKYNPDWIIELLDHSNYQNFVTIPLSEQKLNSLTIPHRSDLIRTQLLIKYGGVWTDPTTYCLRPLNEWLFDYLTSDLFFFYRPGRDRLISNWFIAAAKNHRFLVSLFNNLISYWADNNFDNKMRLAPLLNRILNRSLKSTMVWFHPLFLKIFRTYPYMVYHYMVFLITQRYRYCFNFINEMPKFSADIPHKLLLFGLNKEIDQTTINWLKNKEAPLVKLTWKLELPSHGQQTIIDYILHNDL